VAVGAWLFAVALMVLAMVVVGGATRATGSGLSITQWRPLVGAVPPLSHDAWERLFALYRATPQYRLVNRGMSLTDFQFIFWWEWAHRLLGRIVGVVFLVPFALFLVNRRLPRRLVWPCAGLFLLGAVQGGVGWWMVQSGLEDRISVAPERLAVHLGLALALMAALVWTGLDALAGPRAAGWTGPMRWSVAALLAGVFAQCLLGALVAGNHAGLIDNDWPWMGGRLVPDDYWRGSLWATLAHGPAAAQFNHRIWAYVLLMTAAALAWRARRIAALGAALAALAGGLLLQAALGVATLVLGVPLWLALLHQFTAASLLALAVFAAWRATGVSWYPDT
jgi:cytochrome c oxidase assembly protein subunit 15